MLTWKILDRTDLSLEKHLANLRDYNSESGFNQYQTVSLFNQSIPSPSLLKDTEKTIQRIIQAVKNEERLAIFGHDDVDGVTSSYILYDFLSLIGSGSHCCYIPNRLKEHHGIQKLFLDFAKEQGLTLVITVDGGITSHSGVEELSSFGCETIITDHHLPPSRLPNAFSIINPKQHDCFYPYDMLSGVGVVYLLLLALSETLQVKLPDRYLFWTAVGSIADRVPMTGVNRVFSKSVFDNWDMFSDENIAIWPGYTKSGRDCYSKNHFIKSIIKLMNTGRSDNGEHFALKALLDVPSQSLEIIRTLRVKNTEQENSVSCCLEKISELTPQPHELCFLHFDVDKVITQSLMGYAASYISSKYKIPTLIMQEKGGDLICEARCTEGFNLIDSFNHAASSLKQYGGHARAAGFVAELKQRDLFYQLFKEYVESHRDTISRHRKLVIDSEIDKTELSDLRKIVSQLNPFGEEAKEPVFLLRRSSIATVLSGLNESCENAHFLVNNEQCRSRCNNDNDVWDIIFMIGDDGKIIFIDKRLNSQDLN